MANARNKLNKGDSGRMAGGFIALPWAVLDCPAYANLSHPARSLLVEISRQYVRDNNGRLLASSAYLAKRGWNSSGVIVRAKRELIEAGFIHELVMGHRPNKASWYAITWQRLDKLPGYDDGAADTFRRGAFQDNQPLKKSLTPSKGVERASIAPSKGVGDMRTTASKGAIRPILTPSPTPSKRHHLDTPSASVESRDVLEVGLSDPESEPEEKTGEICFADADESSEDIEVF